MPDQTEQLDRLKAALADRYAIERQLGAGGMATVYLAEDLKHKRKVALKVLKPELAAVLGAERFVQEITTTASLQHPHILPLFDSGEADRFLYYVMPFIEGETLRDKLDREKQLGIEEAVRLTTEVADALDYAHRNNVIHRDIKPENILLHDGRPMVADFGIALAVSAAAGGRMTETGLSLGTPHYMSPEQATAEKHLTNRSDIYSLGAVLYEMLTGSPPHMGSSAQQIIMKIVTEEAQPVTKGRKAVSPNVAAAVEKSLEKLPADRFETAEAFARALQNPGFRYRAGTGVPSATEASRGPRPWLRPTIAAAAALVLGVILGRSFRSEEGTFDVGLPFEAPMEVTDYPFPTFAVSPDASFVVYLVPERDGARQYWYRSLEDPLARPIPGTEGGDGTPKISPNGTRIAFSNNLVGGTQVAPIQGGLVTTVSDDPLYWGGGWLDNGILFSADNDGAFLRWVDPETGPIRDLFVDYCQMPTLLSESDVVCGGGYAKFAMVGNVDETPFTLRPIMQTTAGRDRARLRGSHFRLFDENYLVYTSIDATIMATKFVDRDSLLVGRAVALVPGVRRAFYTGAGFYDVSRDGTLVYAPGENMEVGVMVRRTLGGEMEILPGDPAPHLRFNISPDGHRLASVVEGIRQQELRLYDLDTGEYEVLAQAPYLSTPFWGSEGDDLVYDRGTAETSDLVLHRLNAPGEPRVLVTSPPRTSGGNSLAQYVDSALILFEMGDAGVVAVDASTDPARVDTVITQNTYFARISQDRRWLVWREEAGGMYLTRWPELDRRWTLSTDRPFEPYWLPDGSLLIHHPNGETYTIAIDPDSDPPHGDLELRFDDPRMGETPGWTNSIGAHGEIIYPRMPDQPYIHYLRVVPGWVKQMKRAVDEANR